MKKLLNNIIFKYFLFVGIISSSFIYLSAYPPSFLQATTEKLNDYLMVFRGKLSQDDNVVIIDIDNESLKEIGQWPWSRNTIADLTNKLANSLPSSIAFTIVFSESDRTSPSNLYEKLDLGDEKLEDYDQIFGNVLASSKVPIILGYHFVNLADSSKANFLETPYVPAIFVDKDANSSNIIYADGISLNIPKIQDNAYSSGFLNSTPDELGNIRYSPLLINYDTLIYPSLALESVRSVFKTKKVTADQDINSRYVTFENFNIKTDNLSRMYINFKGPSKTFKHISASSVLSGKFSSESIKDKIVIIGSSASGLAISNNTPFDNAMSIAEIQANAIDNILSQDYLYKPIWFSYLEKFNILLFVGLIMGALFINSTIIPILVYTVGNGLFALIVYTLFSQYNILIDFILIPISTTVALIVLFLVKYIQEQKQTAILKSKFSSKVSKAVMNDLLKNQNSSFSAEKKYITIFFSDIKGFTKITDDINDPEQLVNYLNIYMGSMTNIIMQNYGTVDKFIGDAIMAYWNAPYSVQNHEDLAVTSAILQQKELIKINEIYTSQNLPTIFARMGINSGYALVGEMGSRERSDYTAIGSSVNIAAILEQICKYYDACIVITESVKANLTKNYAMRLLDIIAIENTSGSFDIYEVFDFDTDDEAIKNEIKAFESGVMHYRNKEFKDALLIFKNILNSNPKLNTTPCNIYISRCEKELHSSEDFNPIQHINKKFILST